MNASSVCHCSLSCPMPIPDFILLSTLTKPVRSTPYPHFMTTPVSLIPDGLKGGLSSHSPLVARCPPPPFVSRRVLPPQHLRGRSADRQVVLH